MKVFIETYGCTFNQADSEIMAGILNENGIELVGTQEEADAIIVNTCYVKLPTESKVINRIKNLQKDFPEKEIIVGGCMVEIDPKKLEAIGPNCSWIGPHQLNKTADVVKSAIAGEVSREFGFSDEPKVCVPKIHQNPHIHVIQICEGCLGNCSYCCTRFARGHLNSYPIKDIISEARQAIADGCVEIQLTAQDTSAFGKDTGEKLSDLIKGIANLKGDFRIRVGMMHPKNIGNDLEDLIDAFKLEKVYKFIHLPIQSGSDAVLKDMRRNHTVEDYKKIVYRFREEIPNLTLATDIIVAYPTETEEDFMETADLIEEIKFNLIHLSKYQHREGAASSSLDNVPFEDVKRRSKYLSDIKFRIIEEENKDLKDKELNALVVEKGSKGGFIAKTDSYIPVVLQDVELGEFIKVHIDETTGTYLIGHKI
ncbi:tRNA (N(6)-L-threonylcarbamoyladenosine(37)-C(2))-methylthiotransferase [Methanobrevibacter olleyae]|uniref:tRNA-t(6)A37 methylthiotransferase n=1 Tax=Methanobrevibacter olleyae TaxID=294671 RepID=A0A126R0W1_METOL|nr:tRNA (N(6)-L-threonylcarbamoyladenosine(37)-C(2))-methylthiotransferase [Methanobrevibacter olleyae]AMK15712.1 MiaB-like tRNA modifying enzyme [Methanobrevibacter olleyae]SFL77675.1 MiaB-like tRNA modifying enzyme [Methanobrevibacter olleyae]